MDQGHAPGPVMPRGEDFSLLGPMGAPKTSCTMRRGRICRWTRMLRSVARSSDMGPLSLCRFCQDCIIAYRRSRHSNFQPHSRRHPTSPRCPSAWQPNPGRRSTYRRGKIVQTTGTGTLMAVASSMVLMRCSDFTSTVGCAAALPPPGPIPICQGDILRMSFLRCRSTNSEPSPVLVLCCRRSIRQTRPINGSELHSS